MRIVLDTNVFISGLLRPAAPPGVLLRLVLAGSVPLLLDERILQEYGEVAARPRLCIDQAAAALVLGHLRALGEMVVAHPLRVPLPDPDDLMFLEVAHSGRAQAIVTGNKKHFPPAAAGPVAVLSPSEALDRIAGEE